MKFQLSRSILLMPAIILFISSSLALSTFLTTFASSTIGFCALLGAFLPLPAIQIKQYRPLIQIGLINQQLFRIYRSLNFQMKQKKSKQPHPRRVEIGKDQQLLTSLLNQSNKQVSGHTKMSTNCTIHSSSPNHLFADRRPKSKKNNNPASKQNPLTMSRGLPTSKSSKKIKILDLPIKQSLNFASPPEESYRQYCLVDQSFVPVTNANEKELLQNFLAQTASSSCDYNYAKSTEKRWAKKSLSKLRRKSFNSSKNSPSQEIQNMKFDKAVSNIQGVIQVKSIQIEATPDCTEIGMQYSQRKQIFDEICLEKKIEEQPIDLQKQDNQQSLSNLLFKLQFKHLGDQKSFKSLTSNEKEHFSQLLETMIEKLKHRPTVKTISFSEADSEEQSYSKNVSHKQASVQERLINYQVLESMICIREYKQINWIQDSQLTEDDETKVNTSLFSVINFLCHLFCYIEMQYTQQFIYMIRKMCGYTFRQKYRRITRGIPLLPDLKFKVVDQSQFLQFLNESKNYNPNEIVHLKAVFDAFNQHLEEYRPFFQGNGQQFPWAFKMFITMSQYSIDEDSLQIIFHQAKEKMVEWCSSLCGLIVDHPQKSLIKGNPLERKHQEKQNKMVMSWLNEQHFEKDEIQLFSTQTVHEISEHIYQDLLEEVIRFFI